MIRPLKYQQGGSTSTQQEQLVQLFQAAAENAQVDPQELVQKASEIGQDQEAAAQFMEGLQLCAQGDPEGIKFIKSLFQRPAFRKGGKIWDFVCKHAKGGYVAGCNCGGKVKKGQDGTQFEAPTNYYNEKGWQISEKDALRRNNRTFYTEEPTAAGNIAWTNNQMSRQLMWPGVIQDVEYNQPIGHYIDEYGNMHNFAVEGNDLARYNNRKAQWKETGGKIEKAQSGSLLDYYSNKWGNDLNRIRTGWQRFKESAPGKLLGAFMPNPNSESGMLGAAAPIGKIKYIPEGVSGTESAAKWVMEHTPKTPHIATLPPKQIDETQGAKVINGLREWLYGKWYNGR